jgi:Holliday junction resolvase
MRQCDVEIECKMHKLKTIYLVRDCVRPSINSEIGARAALACRFDVQQCQ